MCVYKYDLCYNINKYICLYLRVCVCVYECACAHVLTDISDKYN